MTEASKHTPTPWCQSEHDQAVILATDHKDPFGIRYAVGFCEPCVPLNGDGDYGQFNAARIVLAVNTHDDLVAALKLLVADVQGYAAWDRPCHALDVAEAALVKAEAA